MEAENTKQIAPYVPFTTFSSALDHLRDIGIPNIIDRAVFPSYSGLVQGQIIGALKFLQLIDDHGRATADLTRLIDNKERKAALKDILNKRYSELLSLDLTKISPTQLDSALSKYKVSGTTHQKAKSFFLKAAQLAEIPLSPLLTRKTRSPSVKKRRTISREEISSDNIDQNPGSGTSKTVTLRSGGVLTLSLTANMFDLDSKDREFVFGIIDKIQSYDTEV